jgi:acetyl esterase/lipase
MTSDVDQAVAVIEGGRRGNELTGFDIFGKWDDVGPMERIKGLLQQMYDDVPTGGEDIAYGKAESQKVRYWKAESRRAPLVLFVHGGSWRAGTYLDSLGSKKVDFLTEKGYAFASVNFTLFPKATVAEQVQEIANSLAFLRKQARDLNFDPEQLFLMGHSSGAHVVSLLGTDVSYFQRAGIDMSVIRGVIALDGSNYNALAEVYDSEGPVADNTLLVLGKDAAELRKMSPSFHAHGRNASAFLLLHAQRSGDIRQAMEFEAVLKAAGTDVKMHVFEGQGYEGHMQILLRLGIPDYPATIVLDDWLQRQTLSN